MRSAIIEPVLVLSWPVCDKKTQPSLRQGTVPLFCIVCSLCKGLFIAGNSFNCEPDQGSLRWRALPCSSELQHSPMQISKLPGCQDEADSCGTCRAYACSGCNELRCPWPDDLCPCQCFSGATVRQNEDDLRFCMRNLSTCMRHSGTPTITCTYRCPAVSWGASGGQSRQVAMCSKPI
jgi:hypothetical protein